MRWPLADPDLPGITTCGDAGAIRRDLLLSHVPDSLPSARTMVATPSAMISAGRMSPQKHQHADQRKENADDQSCSGTILVKAERIGSKWR